MGKINLWLWLHGVYGNGAVFPWQSLVRTWPAAPVCSVLPHSAYNPSLPFLALLPESGLNVSRRCNIRYGSVRANCGLRISRRILCRCKFRWIPIFCCLSCWWNPAPFHLYFEWNLILFSLCSHWNVSMFHYISLEFRSNSIYIFMATGFYCNYSVIRRKFATIIWTEERKKWEVVYR